MSKMKVVQCWDDGPATDVRLTQILRSYGAKATFNLNIGCMKPERMKPYWRHYDPRDTAWDHKGFRGGRVGLKEMRSVYDGFQVASHCWAHENAPFMPVEDFLDAAMRCRRYLEDVFEQECRGFAYPCGRTTPEATKAMREAGFLYGRTVANTDNVCECADTLEMPTNCHFQHEAFYQRYEAAKATGVFYFWGHSYEMFEYDPLWDQLEEKIRFITNDPESEWADVVDIVPLCRGR